MGKFESRDPWYVAGEICAHKWALGDGDRSSMKKCGLPAPVGVPVRIGRFGDGAVRHGRRLPHTSHQYSPAAMRSSISACLAAASAWASSFSKPSI
jgi:hypothetical protein